MGRCITQSVPENKKNALHETSREKIDIMLQWDTLQGPLDKEARGLAIRWRNLADSDRKSAELARKCLVQAPEMTGTPAIKRVVRTTEGDELDEV